VLLALFSCSSLACTEVEEAADAHAPHAPNNGGDVQEEAEGGAPPARENSGLLAGENAAAPHPALQVQAHADNAHAAPSGSFPGPKHVQQIRLQTLDGLKYYIYMDCLLKRRQGCSYRRQARQSGIIIGFTTL
jgi:hypothetical protein